jgi:hypothetical protein
VKLLFAIRYSPETIELPFDQSPIDLALRLARRTHRPVRSGE